MIGVWVRAANGRASLIDREDQDLCTAHRWYCNPEGYFLAFPPGYRKIPGVKHLSLHRTILERMPGPRKQLTDHVNGDRGDNRRVNLRWSTHQQSGFNRGAAYNNQVGFKGVTVQKNCRYRRFRAVIEVNGKAIALGGYTTAEAAARAYDAAARQYAGAYARLNFPEGT